MRVTWCRYIEEEEPRLNKVKKFFIPRNCPIYVAECHASIIKVAKLLDRIPTVVDFDAHFDNYTHWGSYLHCGNWIRFLRELGGTVDAKPQKLPRIDVVFVCKSSPWTPKSMDVEFFKLIKHFARKSRTYPIFVGHKKISLRNGYKALKNQKLEATC